MDRRARKTRKAIFGAFEELISKKRYSDITVQEIIDLANVGRTTFYAHFETKDSVLDALCEELFDHIFEEPLSEEDTHDFSRNEYSENSMLTHILYHLKEDKSRYRRLFQGESANLFWDRFRIRFEEGLDRQIREGKWKVSTSIPEDLYRKLYIGSFIEIAMWWFENQCKETPEQMEAYFESFCRPRELPERQTPS